MNRVFTKKPASNKKLTFAPMGQKPGIKKMPVDVENAADAKKPGDAKEDAADLKKKTVKKVKTNPFAKKAATTLTNKG